MSNLVASVPKARIPRNRQELLEGERSGEYTGYKTLTGYHLELDHPGPGKFPAVVAGTDQRILFFDLQQLRAVALVLPMWRCKIITLEYKVNKKVGVAFALDEGEGEDSKAVVLVPDDQLVLHIKRRGIIWKPGLELPAMLTADFLRHLKKCMDDAAN